MTSIFLTVNGAQAQASVSGPLTSGMVGVPVTIEYDKAWDGLIKNLVCRCSRGTVQEDHRTILNVGNTAVVAHEVMQAGMHLYLGIEGCNADGTMVIPTVWAMCGVIESGANADADTSAEPTLPVWEQLQTEIAQIRRDAVTPEQMTDFLSDIQSAVQASAIYAGRAEAAAQRAEEAAGPSQNGGLTSAQINALDGMFRVCAFVREDVSPEYNAFRAAFNPDSAEGGETPEKTLTGISAAYSGGSVPVGTAVSVLTGIVVTAHYSDGSTAAITGYTLSGTIAEGSNTITVTYQGKTAAFTVTGMSDGGGTGTADVVNLFDKNTMVVEGKAVGNTNNVMQQATGKMAKIPIVAGTTYAASKTGNVWINFQVGNVIFVDDTETLVDSFAFGGSSQVTPVEGTYYPPKISGSLAGSKGLTTAYLDTNNRGFTFDAPVGATYMMFTLCWNGGVDSTNTLMFEMGDTCHDYVAYVS